MPSAGVLKQYQSELHLNLKSQVIVHQSTRVIFAASLSTQESNIVITFLSHSDRHIYMQDHHKCSYV